MSYPPKSPADPNDPFNQGVQATIYTNRIQTPEELLNASFVNAFEAFRTSYVIRYTLTCVPKEGWHQLTIRASKGGTHYTVRARRGYFGASPETP